MGAVAQLDNGNIVAKLRGARIRKRTTEGRCEGAKPYGYYVGEEAILYRMKTLRAQDMRFDRIAGVLNAEALKPRGGIQWYGIGTLW
jgi:site-specific DNA recombinase